MLSSYEIKSPLVLRRAGFLETCLDIGLLIDERIKDRPAKMAVLKTSFECTSRHLKMTAPAETGVAMTCRILTIRGDAVAMPYMGWISLSPNSSHVVTFERLDPHVLNDQGRHAFVDSLIAFMCSQSPLTQL